MEKKIFTIDEVNQLIPQLDYHFRKLLESKQEMAKVSRRLKRSGMNAQAVLSEVDPPDSHPELAQLQESLKGHYQNFKSHTLAIEALGGRIKDLELGRVEFLSHQGDKPIFLVWQFGVTDSVHVEEPSFPAVPV